MFPIVFRLASRATMWLPVLVMAVLMLGVPKQAHAWGMDGAPDLCVKEPDNPLCKEQGNTSLETKTMTFSAGAALNNMFKAIKETFNPKISTAVGKQIVAAFMVLGIVLGAVQIIGGMDFVEAVVRYCKLGALGLLALACFEPVGWLGGNTLGTALRDLFIDGGAAILADTKDPAVYMAFKFMEVFDKAINVAVIPPDITTWYGKLGFVLSNPVSTLIALVMVVLSAVVLLLAGMVVVSEVFMASISMDLALALTPVLAPWIMWRPTSFLFDAWLKTILASGMAFLVASLMGKGALVFVGEASKIAHPDQLGAAYSLSSVAAAYGGFFLLSLIFLFLASRVTGLAASMVRGGILSGVSIAEFRQGVGSLNSLASRGGSAARAGAAVAGGGVGGAVGAVKGRLSGGGARAGAVAGARAGASFATKVVTKLQPGARK